MANLTVDPRSVPGLSSRSSKDDVRELLDRLPDSATLADIHYHLGVVVKVLEAEASVERGEAISQAEFERRFARWLQS